jgi:hypothetical protein
MPRKVFVAGEILTAADVNTNLMDQAVMVFDDSAARGSAIPSPSEGMVTYLKDTDQLEKYTTDWVPAAPGKILQVVSTTKTDTFSTASGTFVDVTNLDGHSHSGSNNYIFTVRDGSNNIIYVPDSPGSRSASFFAGSENNPNSVKTATSSILLSPTTTSAVTYKVSTRVSAGTVYVNRSDVDSDSSNFGRTVSTITAMEVAG